MCDLCLFGPRTKLGFGYDPRIWDRTEEGFLIEMENLRAYLLDHYASASVCYSDDARRPAKQVEGDLTVPIKTTVSAKRK